jgi:hypothetical protein
MSTRYRAAGSDGWQITQESFLKILLLRDSL